MSELKENLRFIVAISKGIARDRRARRAVLTMVVGAAVLMVFVGSVILDRLLGEHPLLFLAYWGACIWLTFLSILMAVHDLLMVRKDARRERQELKARVFGMKDEDPS